MTRVLCLLYDDPAASRPGDYAKGAIPNIGLYPDGQTLPSPATVDFLPGELLGDLSGRLGLAQFLAERGHTLTVTSQQDGPDSVFERALPEAEIVISQACWPACLSAERIAKAHNLKLVITAGVGSDHIDLEAAAKRGITVAEITYSSSISAAEYAVMLILSLVHNVAPASDRSAWRDRKIADYAAPGIRPGGNAGWQRGCRTSRFCRVAEAASIRRAAALY